MKILLVDDDPIINLINRELLKKFDSSLTILEFCNAKKALDFLVSEEKASFLIFLDINMPIMSGWGFLEELKNLDINHMLDVKMLTSSTDTGDIAKSKSFDIVSGFLQKPLTINSLENLVERK